jgi:hypothetical protein
MIFPLFLFPSISSCAARISVHGNTLWAVRAERRALDAEVLEQERAEIDILELAPAEEAEQDHVPVRRERGNVLAPVRDAPTTSITTSAPCPPVARSTSFGEVLRLWFTPAVAPVESPDVTKSRLS